jgi:hypothetical protein
MKTLTLFSILFFLLFQGTSQVTLNIECQQDSQNAYGNTISMDGSLLEYGLCSSTPAFYVTVIDTNCQAWGTRYNFINIENELGNYNNNGTCRQRIEYFFVYRQSDTLELAYMDSLLNYWIPNEHVIAIWTPFNYDFNNVNAVCPQLGNTLINKWGNNVQADSMIVLFGIQGMPQSFSSDTLTNGISISVSKTICPYSSLGFNELSLNEQKSIVRIVDLMGRETEDKPNTLLIYIYSDGTTEKVLRVE